MTSKEGTRSVRKSYEPNLLDKIFSTTDGDVETFVDVLKGHMGEPFEDRDNMSRKLLSGKPDLVSAPNRLQQSVSGFVRIIHGWHDSDYVWHIEPAAIRRPWTVNIDRVIYIIAKIMHGTLPDIEATIWPPQMDWELKTITFKSLGLKDEWSFSGDMIEKINGSLFEALNKVV